uniref:Secreted protein n=1 Tax=Physcomitrium patens TaxID=3218 RepID=A0A7I3ZHN7_PHYPA
MLCLLSVHVLCFISIQNCFAPDQFKTWHELTKISGEYFNTYYCTCRYSTLPGYFVYTTSYCFTVTIVVWKHDTLHVRLISD